MGITTFRTILVYLIQPEDTSAGRHFRHASPRNLPNKTLRRFDMLKIWLWIFLAVIVSLAISNLH